jgi:hypothetical protein
MLTLHISLVTNLHRTEGKLLHENSIEGIKILMFPTRTLKPAAFESEGQVIETL